MLRFARDPHFLAGLRAIAACVAAGGLIMATLLLTGGCTTAPPSASAAPARPAPGPAQIDLVNLSACAWRIAFIAPDGHTTCAADVPVNATVSVAPAAGVYTITQTALTGLTPSASTRRFTATFAAGAAYRWPLVTLLTGLDAAPP